MNQAKKQKAKIGLIILIIFLIIITTIYFITNSKRLSIKDIKNNKVTIEQRVEQVREERAKKAQQDGYPQKWRDARMPQYTQAELKKIREMGKTIRITLESEKSLLEVVDFYKTEMKKIGFVLQKEITNQFIAILSYKKDNEIFALQITAMKGADTVKIQLTYQD